MARTKKKVPKPAKTAAVAQRKIARAAAEGEDPIVIIEASTAWSKFKRAAEKLIGFLAEQEPPVEGQRNPGFKARSGTFEVRLPDGTVIVSLKNMPRPFTSLMALDLEDTAIKAATKLHQVVDNLKNNKKTKATKPKATAKKGKEASKKVASSSSAKQSVVIEACKSWGVFKRSAKKVIDRLAELRPGVSAKMNPDTSVRPRKGTFEVRLADGTVILSLQGMPRPFKKLRALDLEALAEKVASKV